MASSARAFVLRHTRLQQLPGLEGVRLHLTDDVLELWRLTQEATANRDAPLPYWAVAWGGGLALTSYLRDHPEVASGRRVLDLGSGSGLCAIAAMRAGALASTAVDIDPFAGAAIRLNARANKVRIRVIDSDILDDDPANADLILAGDCWYEEGFGRRMTTWLRRAHDRGIDVLIGDPGRRYLGQESFRELASYDVRSTSDIEDLDRTQAWVYELRASAEAPSGELRRHLQ